MRKMASIRKINEILPHPNGDRLEIAVVGGWNCVIRKGDFQAGDLAIFCEIDSWMPQELAPFLIKGDAKEFNGVRGSRLKSSRIRGVLSQGLLIPTHYLTAPFEEGQDVSQVLGIQKWEDSTPDGSLSQPFPEFLHKTDQERVQNIPREVLMGYSWETFEVTEKLDGSSMTVFVRGDESGVCSRNRLIDPSDCSSKFIEAAKKYDLVEKIRQTGRNLALQGELIGDSIQGNPYNILGHRFYVFDIYDIDNDCYLSPSERHVIVSHIEVRHVPVISADAFLPEGIDSILSLADGNSELNHSVNREGLVFKGDKGFSFKAISNNWLLRTGK